MEYDACVAVATHAAQEAGKLMLVCMKECRSIDIENKSSETDLVTQYDKACEDLVRGILSTFNTSYQLIGEETYTAADALKLSPDNETPVWVVDPIDGTTSFIHRSFDCSVSIALVVRGQPVVGVVHIPVLNETFTAIAGRGAFCNGERVKVSSATTLRGSLISVHFPVDRSDERLGVTYAVAKDLLQAPCHGIRCMGSAAMDMCGVAMGRLDAYLERGIWSWDVAAGTVIVREAGGIVTDMCGGEIDLVSRKVLCSSSKDLADAITVIVVKNNY